MVKMRKTKKVTPPNGITFFARYKWQTKNALLHHNAMIKRKYGRFDRGRSVCGSILLQKNIFALLKKMWNY